LVGLFDRLFSKMRENFPTDEVAIQEMIEISSRPTLFKTFIFGKYKGKPIEEVVQSDRGYLEWLYNQKLATNEDTDEDWIYTLEHYLKN
jgi:exodeoxyribonuclease X